MVVDQRIGVRFLDTYKQFLLTLSEPEPEKEDFSSLTTKLCNARKRFISEPTLFERFAQKNQATADQLDHEVSHAIKGIDYGTWVYLRDTRWYSVFLKADGSAGYGVLGLTQPIRELVPDRAVVIKTGVVCLGGRYVCDGVILRSVYLGNNYRASFNDLYSRLRQEGSFKTRYGTS